MIAWQESEADADSADDLAELIEITHEGTTVRIDDPSWLEFAVVVVLAGVLALWIRSLTRKGRR